jgi:hypothetical protein
MAVTLVGPAGEEMLGHSGLQGDDRKTVADHVVHLAGDPQSFFDGAPPGLLFAAALRPCGSGLRFPQQAPPCVQNGGRRRGYAQPDTREDRDWPGPPVDGSVNHRQNGGTTHGRSDPDWQ